MSNREKILSQMHFLQDLDPDELALFSARLNQEQYPAGTRILEEGYGGLKIFILHEGKVRVSRKMGDRELVITILESPQTFGEISVIDGEPASASVDAESDVVAFTLHRDDFYELMQSSDSLQAKVMKNLVLDMCKRVRSTTNQVLDYFIINQALCENENFRNFYKLFGV